MHTQSLFARVVFFYGKREIDSRDCVFSRAKTFFKDLLSLLLFNPIEEREEIDRFKFTARAFFFSFSIILKRNASLPSSKEQQHQTHLYLIIVPAGDEQRLIAVKIHPSYGSVVFVESID